MPAQWTANIVGRMHMYKISGKDIAKHIGVTPEYVSMMLNGHKEPEGAEERFNNAIDEIVASKNNK